MPDPINLGDPAPRRGDERYVDIEPNTDPYVYEEPDIAPPAEDAPTTSALRTATVVSARVVIGIVAIAVAGATIAASALLPLPSIRTPVAHSVVTPVPTARQLVCPGAVLQLSNASGSDATKSSALGRPDLTSASTGASALHHAFEASDAGSGGTASAPQLITTAPVSGAQVAGLLAASQAQSVATDDIAGISSAACTTAVGDSWLVGGATTVGRTTLLTLANPSAVPATVSLEIYGENGAVSSPGMDGIVVPAGGQRALSLAGFAPDLTSPVVHVSSRGGQVVANLQQSTVRGLEPGGVDFVGSQTTPTTTTIIPGVLLSGTGAVKARIGESGFADLETVLRVFLPGTKKATASVSVIPEKTAGANAAAGASDSTTPGKNSGSDAGTPTGTAIKIGLDPGTVNDLPLDNLADGSYTVIVTSPRAVVAGVRVSTAGTAAVAAKTDFAWMSAASLLGPSALVAVGPAVSKGTSNLLHLYNPGKKDEKVSLRAVDGAHPTTQTVTVPASAATAVAVQADTSYRIHGFTSLYGAVTSATDGGVTGYVVQPPEQSSSPLRIYH